MEWFYFSIQLVTIFKTFRFSLFPYFREKTTSVYAMVEQRLFLFIVDDHLYVLNISHA